MSEAEPNPANYCYRHPDRQSFILCQRCGRTICPACQTQAAVGVHCPECTREARASAPRRKPVAVSAVRIAMNNGAPVVTYSIIALCIVVFVIQFLTGQTGSPVFQALAYGPWLTASEPWRMVTAIFVHLSVLHILFNMYSIFVFGPMMERMLGRARYLTLFLLSGIAGSVAVLLISPGTPVAGASGAIFGLLGAFFVIQRHLGGANTQLVIVIVINLVISFVIPGIAWQAHIGGLIVGALVGLIFVRTKEHRQRPIQIAALTGTVLGLIALTVFGASIMAARL